MGKYSNLVKNLGTDTDKIKFTFIKGKYSGGEFSIRDGQRLSIGRDISSDVAIVDSKVSRSHASITARDGKLFIEDHNSTNGTYVNGEKLSPSTETELKIGSNFSVGDSTILVGDEAAPNENAPEVSFKENSFTKARKSQEKTIETVPQPAEDEEEAFTLDESLQIITPDQPESQEKVNIGRLNLKKTTKSDIEKDNLANANTSSTGSLSAMDVADLLKILAQSTSAGYLKLNITSPFAEQIEVTISATGIVACESITNKNFAQEKALSRALLAKDGEYSFKIDNAPKDEVANRQLEDIFMEISNQKGNLTKYRNIANSGKLEFANPIKGKLSDLSKNELDTLQFMVNSKEVIKYLNSFADNDDFILMSEIVKYIDLGIISGNKKFDELSDDIIDF
ncbi:FHA domain-containing protein [bacterium]|nr:FHA domain-containing protein [bacterium]MBP5591218.1 FHA domain-containing protein [bacterium]